MSVVLQSQDEVARRLAAALDGGEAVSEPVTDKPRRFALTTSVVDNLIGFIRNPAERW